MSIDGQRRSYERVHELAHQYADGKWVALGGGGYEWVDVVPRAWTHLTSIVLDAGIAPDAPMPAAYVDFTQRVLGRSVPRRMTDGAKLAADPWDGRIDPASIYDRAIRATQQAVFSHLGIHDDHGGM